MSVATPSKRYKDLDKPRQLPRALMGGTTEMRKRGREFTPQHPAEEDSDYNTRIQSTTLFNGFSDTVKKMTGKVFSKPITLGEDVPIQLMPMMQNIDGQGRNITSFFLDAFKNAMVDGISFVYVDFPRVSGNEHGFATALDQQVQGARPTTIFIGAEDLIGWRSENIGGVQKLTEVRIAEDIYEQDPADEYSVIEIEQIRLLRPGMFELWRKTKTIENSEGWYLHEEGTTSLDYIPIVPVYTNRVGFFEGEPPLLPLADLNLEHWISSGEQRHALTLARFAMMVFTGLQEDHTIGKVSPNTVLRLPDVASKWGLIETSGQGIVQGFVDIEKIEERMRHCGMTVRVQNAGGVTATAAMIDSVDADSALLAAAVSLENSIAHVLSIFANYMGLSEGGSATVYKGFASKQADGTVNDLLKVYVSGLTSDELTLKELKRRGVLCDDVDIAQELQRVNDSAPKLMGVTK